MNYFKNEPYTAYKLQKEFKALCETYHPLNGGDDETFSQIKGEYYDMLEQINKRKYRALYDKKHNETMDEQQRIEQIIASHDPNKAGMTLEPIVGGVAIVGPKETTMANRLYIKFHGGRWFQNEKQWRAYEKPAIKKLCKWFGISYEWMEEEIKEKTYPTLGTIARMVEKGEPLEDITQVMIGRFNNIESFLKAFNESYRPALERLSEGIIQHNDLWTLRHFADDMLMAFGFDLPAEDDAK